MEYWFPWAGEGELSVAMARVADEDGLAQRPGSNAAGIREMLSAGAIADKWNEVIGE